MNSSCQNFGLKTVLEKAYNRFKNCISKYIILLVDEEDINKIKGYKKNNDEEFIAIGEENGDKIQINNQKQILDILNKNENILYHHIKKIEDIIYKK